MNRRELRPALADAPLVAILRGLRPDEALSVGQALLDAGVRVVEVPLNSPEPFRSVEMLVAAFGDRLVLGAGTVTSIEQVQRLATTGARLCVSPHADPAVIRAAVDLGLHPLPGFQTASEAFAAIAAGARDLKFFPAAGHAVDLAAFKTVLPADTLVVAVGGVSVGNAGELLDAGAAALGLGGDLYRPGRTAAEVYERARAWLDMLAQHRPAPRPHLLCNPQALIGESPVWCTGAKRLYWVDPLRQLLLSCEADGAGLRQVAVAAPVWSLALLPDGGLAGALETGFCRVDPDTGILRTGPPAPLVEGLRFNDMTCDDQGGLWAGAMHKGLLASCGSLYHAATPEGPVHVVASGLGVPNGIAFDPTGRLLYLVDTLARTLLAYPADVAAAKLGEPRVLSDFLGLPGKPDGLSVAADGSLWVAMWGGGSAVQLAPDGALLRIVPLPVTQVSSTAIGPGGDVFISSSRMRLSPQQLALETGAGGLFVCAAN